MAIACEQALCLGKKIARKGRGRGERGFSLFPLPCSPLDQRPGPKGLSTGLFAFPSPLFPARPKACSQAKVAKVHIDYQKNSLIGNHLKQFRNVHCISWHWLSSLSLVAMVVFPSRLRADPCTLADKFGIVFETSKPKITW